MAGLGEEFGNPQTVQDLADASRRTAADLRQLVESMNQDVMATVPDRWGGTGATSFQRFWSNFARAIAGLGSPLERYGQALSIAAETMTDARRKLQQAEAFANANGLEIGQDLRVRVLDPSRPDAQAVQARGQQLVNEARRLAETAQQQIRRANAVLDEEAEAAIRQLIEIQSALGGGRRGPRRRPVAPGIHGPQGPIRQPRPSLGRWVGNARNGEWYPNDPQGVGIRLNRPDHIRWHDGVPDLRPHGVPARELRGLNSHLEGLPLRGPTDRAFDTRLADDLMGRRYGLLPPRNDSGRWKTSSIHRPPVLRLKLAVVTDDPAGVAARPVARRVDHLDGSTSRSPGTPCGCALPPRAGSPWRPMSPAEPWCASRKACRAVSAAVPSSATCAHKMSRRNRGLRHRARRRVRRMGYMARIKRPVREAIAESDDEPDFAEEHSLVTTSEVVSAGRDLHSDPDNPRGLGGMDLKRTHLLD